MLKIDTQTPWHTVDTESLYTKLNTQRGGLSEAEANKRLEEFGANTLPHKKPPTLLVIFFHQLINPLIFILIAAAIASIFIGDVTDAIFIFAVILINSALGTYQEFNAEKSAAALQSMLHIITKVKRGGKIMEVDAEELVPGDIVYLETGSKVPADLRLIEVNSLLADESFLTGESLPVEKQLKILPKETAINDLANMCFAGASITGGRAVGLVVATGFLTQVGQIAKNVSTTAGAKPPLVLRMEKFTAQISYAILGISFLLAFLLRMQGMEYSSIFFFVVALAVAAIPEGLPVALTVALSIATRRMSKRNVIVRKLTAVESLGSCTVIASDKTGTLTLNQQTIQAIKLPDGQRFSVTGEGYNGEGMVLSGEGNQINESEKKQLAPLVKASVLANEGELEKKNGHWQHLGDAMDVGFLGLAYKMNMDYALLRQEVTILKEIPYESELKYAAAVYAEKEQAIACMKGAVENVLSFCDHAISDGKKVRLDSEAIEKMADQMAEQGLRVLAVASGELDSKHSFTGELMDYKTLGFLGLVGFIDPLRKEAADAVEKCFDAGIKVLMITGDHPATAEVIAREIGLLEDGMKVVTGTMLKQAGDFKENSFEELALSTNVFARVSPTQKFEIVDVLIRNGEFVAVTGDGVNDTPALRRANIGVAMGSGTDVAKEVGDMIIADDNFSSIVAGVEEGRFAYDNVRKVISLLIATGTGTVVLSIIAVMMGMPLPLLPVQLLWLNLVTNGIQDVALAFEAGEKDAMERKPRRTNESVFNNTMIGQTMVSGFWMGLLTLGFWYYLNKVIHLGSEDLPYARNLLLLLFVLLQNVHVFNCRSERKSAFKVPISNNYLLIGGVVFALAIHVTCMHLPFMQGILHVHTIKTSDFVLTAGLALSLLVVYELYKWFSYGERKVKRLKKLKNSLQPGI